MSFVVTPASGAATSGKVRRGLRGIPWRTLRTLPKSRRSTRAEKCCVLELRAAILARSSPMPRYVQKLLRDIRTSVVDFHQVARWRLTGDWCSQGAPCKGRISSFSRRAGSLELTPSTVQQTVPRRPSFSRVNAQEQGARSMAKKGLQHNSDKQLNDAQWFTAKPAPRPLLYCQSLTITRSRRPYRGG